MATRCPSRRNRSLMERKRRVDRRLEQACRIARFQAEFGIRHPQARSRAALRFIPPLYCDERQNQCRPAAGCWKSCLPRGRKKKGMSKKNAPGAPFPVRVGSWGLYGSPNPTPFITTLCPDRERRGRSWWGSVGQTADWSKPAHSPVFGREITTRHPQLPRPPHRCPFPAAVIVQVLTHAPPARGCRRPPS